MTEAVVVVGAEVVGNSEGVGAVVDEETAVEMEVEEGRRTERRPRRTSRRQELSLEEAACLFLASSCTQPSVHVCKHISDLCRPVNLCMSDTRLAASFAFLSSVLQHCVRVQRQKVYLGKGQNG